jgi:hypothetical protein
MTRVLQVISLEGWTDIMYYVQDAHSFWDWIYFVLLIVVSAPAHILQRRQSVLRWLCETARTQGSSCLGNAELIRLMDSEPKVESNKIYSALMARVYPSLQMDRRILIKVTTCQ